MNSTQQMNNAHPKAIHWRLKISNFVVTDAAVGSYYHNLWCHQWVIKSKVFVFIVHNIDSLCVLSCWLFFMNTHTHFHHNQSLS